MTAPDPWKFRLRYAETLTYANLKSSSQSNCAWSPSCCLMSNTWDAHGVSLPYTTKAKIKPQLHTDSPSIKPQMFSI